MDQRTQFIADHLRDTLSITELCALYGVSRKTGYKWIDRYLRQGPAGLEEQSRRPRRAPNETAEAIVAALLDARRRHPTLGRQETPRAAAQAVSAVEPAWPVHGVRHPEAAWAGAAAAAAATPGPSREVDESRSWRRTMCGARTTKASSGPGMGGTAIR
jgi:transposase-like protein